ncbi:MAG: LytR C-terminal domain-containing protein [Nocardioides sp.]
MPQAARSTLTLGALALVLLLMATWGWSQVTAPFPQKSDPPTCVERVVTEGEKVFADQVTVDVFNASGSNGLAGRTMLEFTDAGFGGGDTGNAPSRTEVRAVQIWTESPREPDVALVASRLGKAGRIVRRDPLGTGVTVVVGDGFNGLVKGPRSVRAKGDSEICTPPVE